MQRFGIDISRHNGNFDIGKAVKEGVEFVILKGAGGDAGLYKDAKFESNYATCKKLGVPVGAYFYSRALNVARAKQEAEFFYDNCLKGKQFEYPVYIDVEEQAQFNLGKSALTDIVKTWCETLENKGYFVGIYSTAFAFSSYMNDNILSAYTHWCAAWLTYCPYKNTDVLGMWQFGGDTNKLRSTKVAGVTTDQNYAYVDFPSVMKSVGFNGFPKPESKPEPEPIPDEKPVDDECVCDYKFTPADARLALRIAVGLDKPTAEDVKLYDLDQDGRITPADARDILRKAVGIENAEILERGDVDMDGEVTSADSRLALRASLGLESLLTEQITAADIDGDGEITSADARLILRKSLNLD